MIPFTSRPISSEIAALSHAGHGSEGQSSALRTAQFHSTEWRRRQQGFERPYPYRPEIDYLERAFDESKYGNFSRQPYLEFDPFADRLACAARQACDVRLHAICAVQLKSSDWEKQRVPLGDAVVKTLAQYAPNLPELILTHQIITPQDLENTYGLTGGHLFHGELALDQFFTMRPLLDWARYRTPIRNLYLCGSGTHPGAGLTGGSGANAAREILKDLRK